MAASIDELARLRRAIELAASAWEAGNPPFGSLLASSDGRVIAEERNTTITDADITAHPELKLARWAARELTPDEAARTTMFTSCQPCPMCAAAVQAAQLGRVVYALSTDQLRELKYPDGAPSTFEVDYDGPQLFDELRAAIGGYYLG